jgi:transposase-like protein
MGDSPMTLQTDPIFTDPDKAREYLEAKRWPHGPFCPHCREADEGRISKMHGKAQRPGLYQCKSCRKQFTVTVGTVMERSHIPINTWLLATFLLSSSKKGMSAHQLHRMLGVTYKTAWFMAHRIREAMRDDITRPARLAAPARSWRPMRPTSATKRTRASENARSAANAG